MSEIIKSTLILKQEAKLQQLEKDIKKARRNLKSYRTRMRNAKKEIEDNIRESSNMMMSMLEKMDDFSKALLELNEQIQASDKIAKDEKKGVDMMIKEILQIDDEQGQNDGGEDFFFEDATREAFENHFGEEGAPFEQNQEDNRPPLDPFEQFKTNIPKEEQQNIRKVYIQLAAKFHPDKATNPTEVEFFHDIMQQINEAYKAGDYLTLMEFENEYANYESPEDFDQENELTNFLDKTIERKERELDLIKNQHQRLKDEMQNLRRSECGQVMRMNKENYWGMTPMEMERNQIERQVDSFEHLIGLLQEFAKTGQMPEELFDEIFPPEYEEEEFMPPPEVIDFLNTLMSEAERQASQPKRKKSQKKKRRKRKS